jgi:beta-mannosidase
VQVEPLSSGLIRSLDFTGHLSDETRRCVVFVAEAWHDDRLHSRSLATFAPNKHLLLTDPGLTVNVSQTGSQLHFDVTARSLARFVELSLAGTDAIFSDNYFDLPAGRTLRVTCPLPANWTADHAMTALQIQSLYNSFAA